MLRLPPQNKAHATFMQPLQCVLPHCDLQPRVQETQRSTHTGTATRCRTQRRNRLTWKRSKPHPPHTGGTFHGRLQPLYTEKRMVSCSGILPKTKPMQHSCSHYNAFCSMTWLTCMRLRTWHHQITTIMQPLHCDLQPQVQETQRSTHTGTTTRCRTQRRNRLTSKRSKLHPPHTGATFHRRMQPPYAEKHKVSCSGFLPKTKPMQHSCSHYNAFCSMTWLTCMRLCTWHHQMTTIMQPLHCDLQPQNSRNAKKYAHRNNHPLQNTKEEPIDLETIQTAPAAHRGFLSWPAAATLHGKTQGFVLRLPPQNKAHATFIQPLQCVLQHDVANPHASTRTASPDDNHPGQFFCDVLLCDVMSHTFLHQGQFFTDVLLCDVKSHTALHQSQFFSDVLSVLLCDVKSHTALHQGQFFCDVLLCDVKISH